MNTNIWTPQNINYIENLTIFKVWLFFLFVKDGGFDVKLLAAKVIRHHMFFFTLSFFFCNNIWKKYRTVLVVKNHDKIAK